MSRFALPVLVLFFSAALTVLVSLFANARATAQQQADFTDIARERKMAVHAQLHSCEVALRGARGLFSASKSVERREWRSYVRGLAIADSFKGLQGMVFIELVRGDGLEKFTADARADEAAQFTMFPAGARGEYRVIKYAEPLDLNQGALGFDSATVPIAVEAQNRARDLGMPAMSSEFKLVQSKDGPGAVIYMPVYLNGEPTETLEQRRAALQGWVAAPLRIDMLLSEVFNSATVPVQLTASDVTTGGAIPLHEIIPAVNRAEGNAYSASENVEFGGRTWKLDMGIAPSFAATAPDMTLRAAIAGAVISLLLFVITLSLTTTRARALALARNMTRSLRQSEERFRAMIEHSSDNITLIDAEGNTIFESPSLEAITGYKPEEVVGKSSVENIHPDDVPAAVAAIERAFSQPGTAHSLTYRLRHKDGSWRILESVGRVVSGEDGIPVGILNSRDVTDRKQAEEALRQSERRFDLAVQGAAVGIWDTKVNGTNWRESFVPDSPVYWSPLIAEMWGIEYADLPQTLKPWIERAHPDDSPAVFQAVADHIDHGKPYCVELRMRHASGEYRWFQSRAEVFRDENGIPTRMAGSLIDITEQKRAVEALRRGEAAQREAAQVQRDVLNALPANVALLDEQGVILAVNESWREFGRDNALQHADSCVGVNYMQLCESAAAEGCSDAANVLAGIKAVLSGGSDLFALQYSCHAPWQQRWFRLMVAPVDRAGRRGCVVMHIDVTERVLAETALARNAAKLAEAQRIGGVGSFELNLETFEVNWSDEAYRIYGVERGDKPLTFETFIAIVHPDDSAGIREATERAMQTGQAFEIEHRVVHADKSVHYIHSHVEVVRSDDGKPLLLTGTNQDITARKQAERQMAQHARVLKEKNEQLDAALIQAHEATRLKSEFLANMSHEIRTPMNGIIGMTGLLLETPLSREQREFAEVIRGSGEALLCIINDILDFSKIEAGKLALEPVEFDLQDGVHEVAELLAKQAQDKGLEMLVRYDANCPRKIVADAGRVRQVILNLVGNAVKFTSVGHVLVDVSARPAAQPDHAVVRVEITDTGIGIAPEKLPLLFQKFSQADASTTRHFGGTGLGLAISRQLIELMGGHVGVSSDVGKGSTFFFELEVPVRSGCPCDVDCKKLPEDFKVIVVDDDEVSRRVLRQLCVSLGMACETAGSGMEALTKMRAAAEQGKPFALGLIDMRMPIMDGGQLARNIKKDARLQSTKLVIVSAHARPDDSTLPVGMVEAVLTKPVRCTVIVSVIQRMFQRDLKTTTTTARIKPAKAAALVGVAGKRVLVAEDNVVNQKLAARMLEKLGCRVDIAANGKEAVQMACAISYDLLLMDCQMPELDGYQATQQIRKATVGRHLPIVAMTANAMEGDREKCLAAGMDDYVSKPMKLDSVRGVVSRWLNLQPAEQKQPLHASNN